LADNIRRFKAGQAPQEISLNRDLIGAEQVCLREGNAKHKAADRKENVDTAASVRKHREGKIQRTKWGVPLVRDIITCQCGDVANVENEHGHNGNEAQAINFRDILSARRDSPENRNKPCSSLSHSLIDSGITLFGTYQVESASQVIPSDPDLSENSCFGRSKSKMHASNSASLPCLLLPHRPHQM
jgi:hypothetical protein